MNYFVITALPPTKVAQLLPISVQPLAPTVHAPPLQSSAPTAQQPQLIVGSGSGGSIITIHVSVATPDGTPTATTNAAPAPASTNALTSLPLSSTSLMLLSPPPLALA